MTRRFNGCLHKQRRPHDPGRILNIVCREVFCIFFLLFFFRNLAVGEKMHGRETRRALFPKTYGFVSPCFHFFPAYCARCVQCAARHLSTGSQLHSEASSTCAACGYFFKKTRGCLFSSFFFFFLVSSAKSDWNFCTQQCQSPFDCQSKQEAVIQF